MELPHILALPFGTYPNDFSIIERLQYPAFKVGWKPEVSVYSQHFNKLRINRVQNGSDKFQFDYWLDVMMTHPEDVFTSDGHPEVITVPLGREDEIAEEFVETHVIEVSEVE